MNFVRTTIKYLKTVHQILNLKDKHFEKRTDFLEYLVFCTRMLKCAVIFRDMVFTRPFVNVWAEVKLIFNFGKVGSDPHNDNLIKKNHNLIDSVFHTIHLCVDLDSENELNTDRIQMYFIFA